MSDTPEQRRKQSGDILRTALIGHLDAMNLLDDGELVDSFVCFARIITEDNDVGFLATSDEADMPIDRVVGLASTTLRQIQLRWEREVIRDEED